jgi:hypothetical protein
VTKTFVPDNRYADAPELPNDRPPTRRECFDHYKHIFRGVKSEQEITRFAADQWAWIYVRFVNGRGWRHQPDWMPGEPVLDIGVPPVFEAGKPSYYNEVRALLELVRERRAA